VIGSGKTRCLEVILRRLVLLLTLVAGIIPTVPALAQQGGNADAQKEAMGKLQHWVGEWEGTGWAATGPGARQEFTIHETVSAKLDGLVLLIQGRGTSRNPDTGEEYVTHDALAVLSFDPAKKGYVFRHYTSRGDYGEDPFVVTEEGYEWGFSIPARNVHMKFAIDLDGDTWHEIARFSPDGSTWYTSMDMTLQRIEVEGEGEWE
jgi:hypothetical protein